MEKLKEKFERRNYPSDLIVEQFERAKQEDRKNLIFEERKNKKKANGKVNFIFTYNQTNPPIHMWLIGKRIQISYKQPRNLQKIAGGCRDVGGGGSRPPPDAGCFKCGQCRVLCPKLNQTTHFTSTATQKRYPIRQHVTCKSDWVVYLGTCLKCKGQYVGKSKTVMKVRHSNHKQEIKNVVGGLGHHYGGPGGCGYNNLSLTIIEQVEEKNMDSLAERELYWQHQLRVYIENGYRNHCRKKEFGKS